MDSSSRNYIGSKSPISSLCSKEHAFICKWDIRLFISQSVSFNVFHRMSVCMYRSGDDD